MVAGYLANAKNLTLYVVRNGVNVTCPFVTKGPNGVEWIPVATEMAVPMLVTPVVTKAQDDALAAVRGCSAHCFLA